MQEVKLYMDNLSQWYNEIQEVQQELILESGEHVKRVAEYSHLVASELGISVEEAELIRKASPLHDIGKMGIPSHILTKPGKLTTEEFQIMKWHTRIGYAQLRNSSCKIMEAAAIIAFEHHERWDGSGYPRNLEGENIHIFGRITSIADVFDALSSKRSYKKAWELNETIDYIKEQRGKLFDPRIVDAFLRRLPDVRQIQEKYREDLAGA